MCFDNVTINKETKNEVFIYIYIKMIIYIYIYIYIHISNWIIGYIFIYNDIFTYSKYKFNADLY